GIVAAQVCRLSGKRPTEYCQGEFTQTADGTYQTVSSVYTEYFVRGTQPDQDCDVHANRSIFSRIAGWVGGVPPAAPVQERIDGRRAGARSADNDDDDDDERRVDAQSDDDEPDKAEEPRKKKRGFWSRLFGRGDKNDEKKPKP
ncbi:MAG: hypothetical protein ACRD1H_02925, partial [Vicinamibacterales bacterium]